MRDQNRLACTGQIDYRGDVLHQVFDRVGCDAFGPAALAVAALVWRTNTVAHGREHWHLCTPAVRRLREAVQAECEVVAFAAYERFEAKSVGFHELRFGSPLAAS